MIYDLNIPWVNNDQNGLVLRLKALEKLGYHAVAINNKVTGKLPKSESCPFIDIKQRLLPDSALRIYTRLTLILDDPQQNYGINSGNDIIKSYDIISVQPETEKMFISACTSLDIDIISLDMSVKLPFPVKAGYLKQAIERGIVFEILYAPIVADGTARRNAIGNARLLLRLALGKKGLLISSGADSVWQLRAPADVFNLIGLLGVNAHLRRNCLESTAETLFMHAASRKHSYRTGIVLMPSEMEQRGEKDKSSKNIVGSDMLEDFIELK